MTIFFFSIFRVIATQLYSTLAKNLILTDPYRIKSTGDVIPVKFHVPVGCQLITAFISLREHKELCENAERIQAKTNRNHTNSSPNITNNNNYSSDTKNNSNSTNNTSCNSSIKTNDTNNNSNNINSTAAYPFHFKKKLMKRDKSIVFTNIPEEGCHPNAKSDEVATDGRVEAAEDAAANSASCSMKAKPSIRPNHLPLSFKNITARDIPESGFSSSITFDEHDSFPQFIGHTSVCSTPMTENKVLHGNIVPICANAFAEKPQSPSENADQKDKGAAVDAEEDPFSKFGDDKVQLIEFGNRFDNFATNPYSAPKRCNSLIDIRDSFRKISRNLSIRPADAASFRSGSDYMGSNNDVPLNNCVRNSMYDNISEFIDDSDTKKRYRTITDPMYPVFNSFGIPISRYLFEEFLSQQCDDVPLIAKNSNILIATNGSKNEEKVPLRLNNENAQPVAAKPLEKFSMRVNNINRKSLSLPLKSLANCDGRATTANAADANNTNIFDKPEQRRQLAGIQLTPLITKLSILAMNDERSSGFSSWDTTPGIELATPLDGSKLFRRRSSVKAEEIEAIGLKGPINTKSDVDDTEMKKVELFICGQNNMTLLLLMEDGVGERQENIHSMVCKLCLSLFISARLIQFHIFSLIYVFRNCHAWKPI